MDGMEEEELLEFSDSDEEEDDRIIQSIQEKQKQFRGAVVREKSSSESESEKEDEVGLSDAELSDDALEEREAIAIQQRHAQEICEEDFEYEFAHLAKAAESSANKQQQVIEDLSVLPNSEKWALIKNESPDLFPVLELYRTLLSDIEKISSSSDIDSADERLKLNIDYCMNINIYLTLKLLHEPNVSSHPVMKRMLEYQTLMKQLDNAMKMTDRPVKIGIPHIQSKRKPIDNISMEMSEEDADSTGEPVDASRRSITEQILRNRGLTPRRKKEYKNPRVKHRLKYRKAVIRRRGQIRPVRREEKQYAGELSGIRAAVKRGVRLKA